MKTKRNLGSNFNRKIIIICTLIIPGADEEPSDELRGEEDGDEVVHEVYEVDSSGILDIARSIWL